MKKLIAFLTLLICILCFPACKQDGETLSVYAPDGAPALSLAYAMKEGIEGVDFNIVGADVIKTVVTGNDKKADIAILPVSDATQLLGNGQDYKILGVVTHGNFYLLSKENAPVSRENANALIGKTIGVVQLAKIPGITLKAALNRLNVPYNQLVGGAEKVDDKVNLLAINPTEIGTAAVDYYLAPSPVADLKAKAFNLNFVGSLHALYNGSGFPQAVLVAKNSVLSENLEIVKEIVQKIKDCENYLVKDNFSEICSIIESKLEDGLTPSFNQNNLTELSVKRSQIKFVSIADCKGEFIEFLSEINGVSPDVTGSVSEDFYYVGESI